MKRANILALILVLTVTAVSHAGLREDVNADVKVIRALRALSQVQLTTSYTINPALAYDFFVPCLDYADHATGSEALKLILSDVESDTRNAVIDIFGKLDYHAAYKGRDSLRSRSLDDALRLLTSRINDGSRGKRLVYLCAATTRFERVEADFTAAAQVFEKEYKEFADSTSIFDLPLMRAAASAQFWPVDAARSRIVELAESRASTLRKQAPLRAAFLYAYAALAVPDNKSFLRLSDMAVRMAPAERMAIEVLLHSRMRLLIAAGAAAQLELIRKIMSRELPGRRAAQMLPTDHVDRITHWASESYINLVPEHYTPQENDLAIRIMDAADLVQSEVRDMEAQQAFDPKANAYTKRFLYTTYQVQDYRRIVGRKRIDLLRQMQVHEKVPLDIDRLLTSSINGTAEFMTQPLLMAYNPGYRDTWKYSKTEALAMALVLYKRTGEERFFDLALTAVQATFLNLTDVSLRWQKIRAAARSSKDKKLAAEVQSLLFGFEPEMMQLLEYIQTVQVGDQPLTRKQVKDIQGRYKKAARRFNNRHKVQNDLFRRMPAAKEIIAAQPPKLSEIRSVLRPREAVIYIARVDNDYLRFLITRDKTRFAHTRDDQTRVNSLVNRMIDNLTPQASGGYAGFDRKTSKELYDLTMAPLERDLKNIDKIVWIGPDALAGLSPEVFTDKKGRLLFERYSVVLNSSLVDLVESRRSVDYRRGAILAVLGIGAPQFTAKEIVCMSNGDCTASGSSGRRFRSATSTDNGALSLAPLPETVTELLSLRDALDPVKAKLLFGPDATVASVQKNVDSHLDLLAFATHGVPGERLESVGLLEPALLLGNPGAGRGAFISTSDIAAMNLQGGPLVVLSACDTARAGNGSIYFDALSGFYQAFRLAGATGVVATQWEVASDAAQRLIPDFVKRVRQGESFDQALRNAKKKLRDDSPAELRHPGYWMPFAFLGDGGATF